MNGQTEFHDWLQRVGCEMRPATNPYEFARFVARGGVHIVYVNSRGTIKASGVAREAWEAFVGGHPFASGIAKVARTKAWKVKSSLIDRDGNACFYCGKEMPEDDMSVEHLVSIDKGGPNHMDNLALTHRACNKAADNLPLVAKIRMHCAARHP